MPIQRTNDWASELEDVEATNEGQYAPRAALEVDVADGGYLSWLYGSSTSRHAAWPPHFVGRKPVILMDSRGPLFRKLRSPHYKSGREVRRDENPLAYNRKNLVMEFRNLVEEEDGRFTFARIEGLEADDLVALAAWKFGSKTHPLRVMGIDKDFLQLPVQIIDKDGQRVELSKFQYRLPKALQEPVLTQGWQLLISLALLGDKSDSVPRVLAPRTGLSFLANLWDMTQNRAFLTAFDHYGVPFLNNLYDVILPDPHILGMDRGDVFSALTTTNSRWDARLYHQIKKSIDLEVSSWNLSPPKRSRKSSAKQQTPLTGPDFDADFEHFD